MINQMANMFKKASQLPKYGLDFLVDSYESNNYEKTSSVRWEKLSFNDKQLEVFEHELRIYKPSPTVLTQSDRNLVEHIKKTTTKLNRNNVTRTRAYFEFYKKHPEVHWAFLAHLVSRNGGWNMTDLKGNILPKILPTTSSNEFFSFLERANALIFHDAYPQLLLYEASKQRSKNLFHLLPKFHVSKFMRPFWDHFFKEKDSKLLTVALIINEQNYIEKRVVQHPSYKEKVLDNILFKLQEWLQFTYVLFPYTIKGNKNRLAGITVTSFEDVHQRIQIGKKLYCVLFGIEDLYADSFTFAKAVPHTGSRSDYWPMMFTKNNREKLDSFSFSCKPTKPAVFSPTLTNAWSDVSHSFTDHHDWFHYEGDFHHYFEEIATPTSFDLSRRYCQDLNKMIAASSAIEIVK
ncbi:DUF2515 domain-containing protein [Anaerobacillus isosaccharinicus]|uniref:DUF2515 domain-containing protein n=1 Tax=Anaerobacillus isosaccharinicus TaxID=1532552 RepID=A0A1S2M1T7_9BACI|nr:DUF2515 domain-containing protein [Anaerobacillus isosaccharinicus]MBA5586054.1 DUF2515 domain-containing protein [Anaerobacillus isosaccharinicus]QOY35670.1 DUF2515 domain-containing protein [Anaerobacillus isosaccharinicus]